MKSLILFVLFVVMLFADEKVLELENNEYQMENICSNPHEISDDWKRFDREYRFTFNSRYNEFEYYGSAEKLTIETDLYTIYPKRSLGINKKTIQAVFNEDDMKKLYKSNSAKVIFNHSLFALKKDLSNYYRNRVFSIELNINQLNREQAKCTEKENKYIKEYDEYHNKPINRIKTFFGSF